VESENVEFHDLGYHMIYETGILELSSTGLATIAELIRSRSDSL
jgi:hypothetical protein